MKAERSANFLSRTASSHCSNSHDSVVLHISPSSLIASKCRQNMFEKFKKYRSVSELKVLSASNYRPSNPKDLRELVNIAVIDDDEFWPKNNLEALNYKITFLGDIKTLDEVSMFSVILCDLQGVGRFIDKRGQGAFIINEIKKNFPDKFVIAYTAGALDSDLVTKAKSESDFFIKKDADMDDWRDTLDEVIGKLSDPVWVWNRQRSALLAADVPTIDIAKLEDAYVSAVVERSPSRYQSYLAKGGLNSDLRAVAQSLVASVVFKMMGG